VTPLPMFKVQNNRWSKAAAIHRQHF